MTDGKVKEIRINNPFAKEKRRRQERRAFENEAHQQRQAQPADKTLEPQRAPVIPEFSWDYHMPLDLVDDAGTTDKSTPALTFGGLTPLPQSIPTPEAQCILSPHVGFGENREVTLQLGAPVASDINELPGCSNIGMKRRVPVDFDNPGHIMQKVPKQSPGLSPAQEILMTGLEDGSSPTRVNTLEPVMENTNDPTSSRSRISRIEDKIEVPRGFIARINRWSFQSRISLAASSHFSGSSQSSSARQSSHDVLQEVDDLFRMLRLTDVTDEAVATQIRDMLQECSRDQARRIVTARNGRQETTLEVALARGNGPAFDELLKFGADVKAFTSDDRKLTTFGRALQRDASDELQVAIEICMQKIRSHKFDGTNDRGHRRTGKRQYMPHPNIGSQSEPREEPAPAGCKQSGSNCGTDRTPQSIGISDQDGRPELTNSLSNPSNPYPFLPGSIRQNPGRGVAELIDHYNHGTQQQLVENQTSAAALSGSQSNVNVWSWNTYITLGESNLKLVLPDLDRSQGSWQISGNIAKFVLHSPVSAGTLPHGLVGPFERPSAQTIPDGMSWGTGGQGASIILPVDLSAGRVNQRNSAHSRRHGIVAPCSSNGMFMPWLAAHVDGTFATPTSTVPPFCGNQGYASQDITSSSQWSSDNRREIAVQQPDMEASSELPGNFVAMFDEGECP